MSVLHPQGGPGEGSGGGGAQRNLKRELGVGDEQSVLKSVGLSRIVFIEGMKFIFVEIKKRELILGMSQKC